MASNIIITIDGPSGSGKTTAAKLVAKKLNLNYCNSGNVYRAITYLALSKNIDISSEKEIMKLFSEKEIVIKNDSVYFDDSDITPYFRNKDVSENVSTIASYKEIRDYVTNILRKQVKGNGIVMEGRDIGSFVFPDCPFKFYLDAGLSIRKERRLDDSEIEERDKKDSSRLYAPLVRSKDSLLIKTDDIPSDMVSERIIEKVRFHFKKNYLYFLASVILPLFFKIFLRLSVFGADNIPKQGPFMVASNHLSFLDPPVIGIAFSKRELHYFAKKELFIPIFGWLISKLNAHPVDRSGFNKETIKNVIKILENGGAVLIFPEGTRGGKKAEPGIGMITYLSNKNIRTPIIPVKVIGTDKALGRGEIIIKPRKTTVIIGRPIEPENLPLKDYQKTAEIVMKKIETL